MTPLPRPVDDPDAKGRLLGYLYDEFADSNDAALNEPDPGDQEAQPEPIPQWGQKWESPPPSTPADTVIEGFIALCKAGQVKGLGKETLTVLWNSVGIFITGQIQWAASKENTYLTLWWKEVAARKQEIEGGATGASALVSAKWFADIQKFVEQKAKDK